MYFGRSEDVRAKLLDAFEQLEGDAEFQEAMKATANPVEVVTGDAFKALTGDLYDLARGVWEETPWN